MRKSVIMCFPTNELLMEFIQFIGEMIFEKYLIRAGSRSLTAL